jgi:hypothetical protein
MILLVSASQIARIAGMSHQAQLLAKYLITIYYRPGLVLSILFT